MKKNKEKLKKVGFPGTFDPMHLGQLDVLMEACNPKKKFKIILIPLTVFDDSEKQSTMFSLEERVNMLKKIIESRKLENKVSVKTLPRDRGQLKFSIREFLKKEGISQIIRGIREDNKEKEFENRTKIEDTFGIKVLFIRPYKSRNTAISSSLIKEMMKKNEDIKDLVPSEILKMIFRKK